MEEDNPTLTQTDSVQIGDNAIGPSTGDIIINSGSNEERCSMCKTPMMHRITRDLYCFKEGCDTLFVQIVNHFSEQSENQVRSHTVQTIFQNLLGQ